ncbi:MAG TPA: hypothetical protein PLF21_05910 [Exilispira sp.]|nr:hypothetical protein [Exilispira sp.]
MNKFKLFLFLIFSLFFFSFLTPFISTFFSNFEGTNQLNSIFSSNFKGANQYFNNDMNYERKIYFTIQSFSNEDSFEKYLLFLKNNKVSGITFYGLHKKLKFEPSKIFARLKNEINDLQIYIAGDNFDFFKQISEDKELMKYVSGFHIEYEYWNYYKYKKKNREEAFNYFIEESKKIKDLTNKNNIKFEAYFGWFNQVEANSFINLFDSISIHAYTKNPEDVGNYIKERIITLYKTNNSFQWFVLCSAERDFMKESIEKYGLEKLEKMILESIKATINNSTFTNILSNPFSNYGANSDYSNFVDYLKNFRGFYWFTGEKIAF